MSADAGPGAVDVRPVKGKKELTSFIKVPFGLHDGTPWVPPLIMERKQFLDRSNNPFFDRAEVELLIAWREGEPVGRISVQVDPRWDEHQGGEDAQFGFFEAEDDPEVFSALFAAAETWARDRGRNRLVGPMDFTTNDECGLLIEGYDLHPLILQPWHPPYYKERIEALGYGKAMDLLMWNLDMGELKQGDRFADAIHMVADKVESEHGITVRNIDKRNLEPDIGRFMEVYNAAWDKNWGFVPVDDDEAAFQAKNLKQVIDENWCFIAERDGETLGAAFTLPDLNQVTKGLNGRLLPFGWLKFLMGKRKIDRVRVFALGVKPEYQHTGIAARFYVRHIETAAAVGVTGGDTGWILEVNEPMNRAMEGMGGTVVKKYRLFEKTL